MYSRYFKLCYDRYDWIIDFSNRPMKTIDTLTVAYCHIADSKRVHFQWKQAGKPAPEHPLSMQRKVLKKQLRTLQL